MAHSPSPQAQNLAAAGSSAQVSRLSPTPPFQLPQSKKDKKRSNMMDKLNEISTNFAENRDLHYRRQLATYQADINYINMAQLYDNKPLEEPDEESGEEATTTAIAQQPLLNGSTRLEATSSLTGKNTAMFIHEINNAMEERDAELSAVAYNHNFVISQIQQDNLYQVNVAFQEHQRLAESLRQRLVHTVRQKIAALERDKEKLDIADTTTLLHHPSQFSLISAASPGGPQSNRKTRHTRHRLEVDDLDAAGGNNKRKRKNGADNDSGSPGPSGRDAEPVKPWKETDDKRALRQARAPIYTIDRLFTERELTSNLQQSSYDVLQLLSARRRKNGTHSNPAPLIPTNADITDMDDDLSAEQALGADGFVEDVFLTAPEMERSGTNASYHATRSTRTFGHSNGSTNYENLGWLAGREAAVGLLGTYHREKKNNDEYQRASALSDQEAEEDMALIYAAIQEESAGKAGNSKIYDEVVEEREDYVWDGETETNGVISHGEIAAEDEGV